MKGLGVCVLALALATLACGSPVQPRGAGGGWYSLALQDEYVVEWLANVEENWIELKLWVENGGGWVGFGIGEPFTGSMPGADVMAYSTPDFFSSDLVVSDRHTVGFFEPVVDDWADSEWELLAADVADGTTYVHVKRRLLLDDCSNQDRDIPAGHVNVIAAWGSTSFLSYHGPNRIASQVQFYTKDGSDPTAEPEFPEPKDTIDFVDVRMDTFVPDVEETGYYCQSLEVEFDQDVHIIGVDTLWANDESDALIHHWIVYSCTLEPFSRYHLYDKIGRCDDDGGNKKDGGVGCNEVMAGWAPGTGPTRLPAEAGFRSGPSQESMKYLLLEFHIDNPKLIPVTANLGVRLWYTTAMRQFDAGTLMLGDVGLTFPDIPPNREAAHYEAVCPKQCSRDFPTEIYGFSLWLHAHQAATMMYNTLHPGAGNDGYMFGRAEYYNFNFQRVVPLDPPQLIRPGDSIHTHCVYNTVGRTEPTIFHEGSLDEMCITFMSYYPRMPQMAVCGYFGGLTACGDFVEVDDYLPVLNPGFNAEGRQDARRVFGGEESCPVVVSGTVFYDLNGNGQRDNAEPVAPNAYVKAFGVRNVPNSAIYQANENGEYAIELDVVGRYRVGSRDVDQDNQGVVGPVLLAESTTVDIGLVPLS